VSPKRRVIDLRAGDWLTFKRRAHKIVGLKAYRDAWWTEGRPAASDGYEVRAG
jgi:hypothetical protein